MKRYYAYLIVGLIFGLADWYFVDWINAQLSSPEITSAKIRTALKLANVLVWLAPIVPVLIYETRRAANPWQPMLAGALVWSAAIVAYYSLYAWLLSQGRIVGWEHLSIHLGSEKGFWVDFWSVARVTFLKEFRDWIWVALVGGGGMGLSAWVLSGNKPFKMDRGI